MDRSAWPTRERIQKLRAEGIAPYSRFATASLVALAVLASIAVQRREIAEQLTQIIAQDSEDTNLLQHFSDIMLTAIFVPALIASSVAILFGLIQTKFLFRWANLEPKAERLSPFKNDPDRTGRLQILIQTLSFNVFVVVGALALLIFQIVHMLQLLNNDSKELVTEINSGLTAVFPFLAAVLLGMAGISWVGAGLAFRNRHRMSRKEIEQEQLSRE